MPVDVAIYVLGACVAIMALAMLIQGWAALSMLLTFKPLLPKGLQTVQRGKLLARETQTIINRAKPNVARAARDTKAMASDVSATITTLRMQLNSVRKPLLRLRNKAIQTVTLSRPAPPQR